MLRESIRHESIAEILLTGDALFRLLDDYVSLPDFDVASDAFATVKELLTRHHALVARFLDPKSQNYDAFFGRYATCCIHARSKAACMTVAAHQLHKAAAVLVCHPAPSAQGALRAQRPSRGRCSRCATAQLLGELLLDRSNFAIMMRFIQDKQNLKLMMNLLRDKAPSIQFEAFHVFKVRARARCSPAANSHPCLCAGVRGKPQEAGGDLRHPIRQPRQVGSVSARLPRRQRCGDVHVHAQGVS